VLYVYVSYIYNAHDAYSLIELAIDDCSFPSGLHPCQQVEVLMQVNVDKKMIRSAATRKRISDYLYELLGSAGYTSQNWHFTVNKVGTKKSRADNTCVVRTIDATGLHLTLRIAQEPNFFQGVLRVADPNVSLSELQQKFQNVVIHSTTPTPTPTTVNAMRDIVPISEVVETFFADIDPRLIEDAVALVELIPNCLEIVDFKKQGIQRYRLNHERLERLLSTDDTAKVLAVLEGGIILLKKGTNGGGRTVYEFEADRHSIFLEQLKARMQSKPSALTEVYAPVGDVSTAHQVPDSTETGQIAPLSISELVKVAQKRATELCLTRMALVKFMIAHVYGVNVPVSPAMVGRDCGLLGYASQDSLNVTMNTHARKAGSGFTRVRQGLYAVTHLDEVSPETVVDPTISILQVPDPGVATDPELASEAGTGDLVVPPEAPQVPEVPLDTDVNLEEMTRESLSEYSESVDAQIIALRQTLEATQVALEKYVSMRAGIDKEMERRDTLLEQARQAVAQLPASLRAQFMAELAISG